MNNQQILTKAIQKAIDGGWPKGANFRLYDYSDMPMYNGDGQVLAYFEKTPNGGGKTTPPSGVKFSIFNHDFAKALWGETTDYTVVNMPYPDTPPQAYLYQNGYKYHLQQMVIADDPIKYLGEHLPN